MPVYKALSQLSLPDCPAIWVTVSHVVWLSPEGEIETLSYEAARSRLHDTHVLVCNARQTRLRLQEDRLQSFDLLELFAFVYPARACVPTPRGLARALDLAEPATAEEYCVSLMRSARALLMALADTPNPTEAAAIAAAMEEGGWPWGPYVMAALRLGADTVQDTSGAIGLKIWKSLPEWQDEAPLPPPSHFAVDPSDARHRLSTLVARALHSRAEPRPQQADYASAVSLAFAPRATPDEPNVVIAEAGTGIGKTLGYLAPSTLWAERNRGTVWISTYTRNLQRQIDHALQEFYDEPDRVVVRKGRENYLCLLNFEEALRATAVQPVVSVPLGLMARWIGATKDGDLTGDFPFWLVDLFGRPRTTGLSDRRGECIYSACEHYKKCFIERGIRKARQADIVIANHALVMVQAALQGGMDDTIVPTRYVFDEGHHLFDAADGAFSTALSGGEASELRRWLVGWEASKRSRARGLKRRIEDVLDESPSLLDEVNRLYAAAQILPAEGWLTRLVENNPLGPIEEFLAMVRTQVYARSDALDSLYSLEADTNPLSTALLEKADDAASALAGLQAPINAIIRGLRIKMEKDADTLDSDKRRRIEILVKSLTQRGLLQINAWIDMLSALSEPVPENFVDWFSIERIEGRDFDIGLNRHWVDPTVPFAKAIATHAHGMVVTSATMTDGSGNLAQDWLTAETISGARHFSKPAIRAQISSPYDYKRVTRVLVVNDVNKRDIDQVASAYRALFSAAGGGGLGLFTSIQRLRAVHERIAVPLETAGIDLYAQHIDGLNVATLVDIFRSETNACLLGTDAIRDGVDVPGNALRLIVFDRVPWPRPDILHRARREVFGGKAYDERLTRLKLKQAFGRLIRREDDRGVFVLLDPGLPSRLTGAFPPGVIIERVGLAHAVAETKSFLTLESLAA